MAPRSYYSLIFHIYLVIQEKENHYYPLWGGGRSLEVAALELLDLLDQAVKLMICDLNLSFDSIDLGQELPDTDIHQVHDELLDNDHCAE